MECSEIVPQTQMTAPRMEEGAMTTARVMNGGLRGTKSATKREVNALSTIIRTAAPATVARIQCNATGIASQTHATETTGEVGQEKGEENRENHPRESRIF